MHKKIVFIILLFIVHSSLFMVLSGCGTFSKKSSLTPGPVPLEPQGDIKFADVPVPRGFKLLAKESYSFQTGNTRVAVLKYTGRPNTERAFMFYKEQMPIYNWNLINTTEYGIRMLNFEREQETCIITIQSKGLSTLIIIAIGPKQTAGPKSNRPVK